VEQRELRLCATRSDPSRAPLPRTLLVPPPRSSNVLSPSPLFLFFSFLSLSFLRTGLGRGRSIAKVQDTQKLNLAHFDGFLRSAQEAPDNTQVFPPLYLVFSPTNPCYTILYYATILYASPTLTHCYALSTPYSLLVW
jgi:hypothetical protein